MAAPIQTAVQKFCRPIFGNLHKLYFQRHLIPAANFCEEAVSPKRRLKFNVTSLHSTESHEPEVSEEDDKEPESFASMFRKSKFVQLGDLKDRTMAGRIFYVVNDDLYINFGGKFYCVCPRPSFQANQYVKGQRVMVLVHKFEMTSSFLGSAQHLTLLEADATLMGLYDQHLPQERGDKFTSKGSQVSGGFASKMISKQDGVVDQEKTINEEQEKFEDITGDRNPVRTDSS